MQTEGTDVHVLGCTGQRIKAPEANRADLGAACVHNGEIDTLVSNILIAWVVAIGAVSVSL